MCESVFFDCWGLQLKHISLKHIGSDKGRLALALRSLHAFFSAIASYAAASFIMM